MTFVYLQLLNLLAWGIWNPIVTNQMIPCDPIAVVEVAWWDRLWKAT
jgi:hypothetical protein